MKPNIKPPQYEGPEFEPYTGGTRINEIPTQSGSDELLVEFNSQIWPCFKFVN